MDKITAEHAVGIPRLIIQPLVFLAIALIVLNPYTIYGKPGLISATILVIYAFASGSYKVNLNINLLLFSFMLFISLWGALFSYINGIGQGNHPIAVITLIIVVLSSQAIHCICKKIALDFNDLVFLILCVLLLNYMVIILELINPPVRDLIERFLAPAGNIDWTDGFKYRGLSSSGGAGLSVCTPIFCALALYLLEAGRIGAVFFIIIACISIFTTLVIGRTGFILLPIVFFSYAAYFLLKKKIKVSVIYKAIAMIVAFFLIANAGYGIAADYLSEKFGLGFMHYAFDFLLDGSEGLEGEGTVEMTVEFLKVVPSEFSEIITGYGFYGGSYFDPWTDSGFARMFLSVGFLLGGAFYFCICKFYFNAYKYSKFLVATIALVLLGAETKEPLLFSGNASRIFVLIVVFLEMDSDSLRKENKNRSQYILKHFKPALATD